MNGGKKKKRNSSSGYPHRKISQILKSILGNRQLLHDAAIYREELKKGEIREIVDEAIKSEALFSASLDKEPNSNNPIDKALILKFDAAHSIVANEPDVQDAALVLAMKYKLRPESAWSKSLINLILYGYLYPPSFESLNPIVALMNGISSEKQAEIFDAINKLRGQNFGVEAKKDKITGKLAIFIELFQNTSKSDIVAGWGDIKKIKDLALGKRNFYPLKNLELANKISSLDESKRSASDDEKAEEIFGEAKGVNWGKTERKRKRKIQQIRSRYKKK